ncbi:ABC transporter permease subunit [Caldiplasma sukawensis]
MRLSYYILVRIVSIIPTVFVLLFLSFVFLKYLPGNSNLPIYSGGSNIFLQFLNYFEGVLHGNLGNITTNVYSGSVSQAILYYMPETIFLGAVSFIISYAIALPLSDFSAKRIKAPGDFTARIVSLAIYSLPLIFLSLLMIFYFPIPKGVNSFSLGGSAGNPSLSGSQNLISASWISNGISFPTHILFIDAIIHGNYSFALTAFESQILPIISIVALVTPILFIILRSGIYDSSSLRHIKLFRSMGVSARTLSKKHIRRNGITPSITISGLIIAYLFGGVLIVEKIFNIDGLGFLKFQLLFTASGSTQVYGLLAVILIFGIVVMVVNIIVDVIYRLINPEYKY